MRIKSLKRKAGQNTAEYLILLVLAAIGTIGLFSVFGSTMKTQLGQVINAMQGRGTGAVTLDDDSAKVDSMVKEGASMNLNNAESLKMYKAK